MGAFDLALTIAAVALFGGLATLVGVFSWHVTPCSLSLLPTEDSSICFPVATKWSIFIGVILVLAAGTVGAVALRVRHGEPSAEIEEVESDSARYGYTLVGLGYVLLLVATLNIVALGGFAKSGSLEFILPEKDGVVSGAQSQRAYELIRLFVSLGMAQLGALFFVTNALRRKRDGQEPYDTRKFWAGLWYRLGEAVLFTLVFFLAFRLYGSVTGQRLLPLISLCLGMFVTTGEALVFGLVQRVLSGASALVGTPERLSEDSVRPPKSRKGRILSDEEFADEKARALYRRQAEKGRHR